MSPTAAAQRTPGPTLTFDRLRVALLFVGVAVAAGLLPAQADTYWHLRAGEELFRTGHVPLIESYSYTANGRPWPNHEWLWQAVSYAAYRMGGMPLLTALAALLSMAACAISYRLMRASPPVNFGLALVGVALASVVWAIRPQVASLFFLMALVALVARGWLWPLPPLFWLWANLHGAVALGIAVLVTATAVSLLDDRRRAVRLAILTLGCAALTAATPLGFGLWRFIAESMARSRRNQVLEWQPSFPRGPVEIGFWLAVAVLVVLVARRWRRVTSWEDRLIVALALLLAALAARAVRNIAPFALLWMPAVSRLLRPERPPTLRGTIEHPVANGIILGGAVVAAIAVVAGAWSASWQHLGWRPLPSPLVSALRDCRANLYNRYNDGGYVLWFVPEVPVFIDSRQDPYPAELLTTQAAAERSGDYAALFARFDIGCALVPTSSPIGRHLTADGWRDVYRDPTWLLAQRR